jgi:ribonuclease P protein component
VLPAAARLTAPGDFAEVIRRGRRFGRTLVVMHALLPDQPSVAVSPSAPAFAGPADVVPSGGPDRAPVPGSLPGGDQLRPRVGFVVSKAVGGSVVRHRVTRRLRHVLRDRLDQLPPGTRLVVRALPASAAADSASLAAEVDRALRAVLTAGERRSRGDRSSKPSTAVPAPPRSEDV